MDGYITLGIGKNAYCLVIDAQQGALETEMTENERWHKNAGFLLIQHYICTYILTGIPLDSWKSDR